MSFIVRFLADKGFKLGSVALSDSVSGYTKTIAVRGGGGGEKRKNSQGSG